ncbi:MAG: hypothetical protein AAFV53_09610 [Myxococcota bacterium]
MIGGRVFGLLFLIGCDVLVIQDENGNTPFCPGLNGDAGDADDDLDPDCEVERTPVDNQGPACVTEALACGDRVEGTTTGGDTRLSGADYNGMFCAVVGDSDFVGPERVYSFTHPGDSSVVTITLTEPCGGANLFLMSAEDPGSCPSADSSVRQCDNAGSAGRIELWDEEPRRYLLVVDGAEEGAPFNLSISCP